MKFSVLARVSLWFLDRSVSVNIALTHVWFGIIIAATENPKHARHLRARMKRNNDNEPTRE